MNFAKCRTVPSTVVSLAVAVVVLVGPFALFAEDGSVLQGGNYDARQTSESRLDEVPTIEQLRRVAELRAELPGLVVRYGSFGTSRVLWNRNGYLTDPLPGASLDRIPRGPASDFLSSELDLLGLTSEDWADREAGSHFVNSVTGATRMTWRQTLDGVPVYNASLQIQLNREGRVISVNNGFFPSARESIEGSRIPIGLDEAVQAFAAYLGLNPWTPATLVGPQRESARVLAPELSPDPVEGRHVWLPVDSDRLRRAWNFQIGTHRGDHYFDVTVDAETGQVWTRFDWVARDRYRVYPQPVESPSHTTPVPPADGRVLVTDPQDPLASPLGWHDDGFQQFTITRGNNVHAYEDQNFDNEPPEIETDCGIGLDCDFPIDLEADPRDSVDAAVTNLFYWNNLIHDVQYQYGFDEEAGNFQHDNFGLGGLGGDPVDAEAQDGLFLNNANFFTPPDGAQPRMQMFLFTGLPLIDSDYDAGVIAHEYAHGVSNRQVGGPDAVGCLTNRQHMGEGWSDWFGLWYTAEVGDSGTDGRGIGTYVLGQAPDGPGVRTQRYSTDQNINNWTFETIGEPGVSVPHGVGAVWAQVLWEMYWALVDEYGFDPDLYDAAGGAGNQRAMLYVNEGMQNAACLPSFIEARDAIIMAVADNYGGEDLCRVWETFAAFGLGLDAATKGSDTLVVTNGFNVPPLCGGCNFAIDADCDGRLNEVDNCLTIPNPDQRDTDLDTFGNLCDPDLDNDGIVNFIDLGLFRDVFLTDDEDADFNGDGFVNFLDFSIMRDFFFLPPGPSGIDPDDTLCGGACD